MFELGNGELFELNEEGEVINIEFTSNGIPIEELKTIEDFAVPVTLEEMEELEEYWKGVDEGTIVPDPEEEESAVDRADLADYEVSGTGELLYTVRRIEFTITGFYRPAVEIMQYNASAETTEVTE